MFTSIIDTVTGSLTIESALICTVVSVALGILIAILYRLQSPCSKNYLITLIILPALVQVIIMLVNGNLGTGVAIMGAFSLVRFRSIPGSAREICGIFFAMVVGVATGMGYLTFAAVITVIVGVVMLLLGKSKVGELSAKERQLRITIAENLDYTDVFDDLFQKYTSKWQLQRVKTTNMGSMFELRYDITLRNEKQEKEFIDELRTRNGNLTIMCGRALPGMEQL